jgi:hypothetical protein
VEDLFCEELADVCEGLEFQGVSCGVEEEHGGLFTDFTLEADVGLDDEGDSGVAKAIGETLPNVHGENYAEVWDGDVVAVHGVVMDVGVYGGLEMGDDLMAEEIEVDPLSGAAAFWAAEDFSVKGAGGVKVVDRKGYVKRSERHRIHHTMMRRGAHFCEARTAL